MPFLGRKLSDYFFEAWKWKLLICSLVVLGAEISMFIADVAPIKNRIYVGILIFCMSYVITFFVSYGAEAFRQLTHVFDGVVYMSEEAVEARSIKHNFAWRLNFILGLILFAIFFDILIFGGIVIGFLILFGPLEIFTWRYVLTLSLADPGDTELAIIFVAFLIFVVFAGLYARKMAYADAKMLKAEKLNPWFVFKRTLLMWWTFGAGDIVRSLDRPIKIRFGAMLWKVLLGYGIGYLIDSFHDTFIAVPICVGYGMLFELIKDLYRIDKKVVIEKRSS